MLPVKCNGKLLFPLCGTCAENMQQTMCDHTDNERAIIGTWITEEVKLSVKKGYKVIDVSFNFYIFYENFYLYNLNINFSFLIDRYLRFIISKKHLTHYLNRILTVY